MANWATTALLGDPSNPEWQAANLKWIEPIKGQRWQVYNQAAPAFEGLLTDLAKLGYTPTSSGGFNYRNIRGGDRLSQHAFGTAIDINALANQLGQSTTDIPQAAELAAKYGLEWGGNWKGRPDPMHFEYTGQGWSPSWSPGGPVEAAGGGAGNEAAKPAAPGPVPDFMLPAAKKENPWGKIGEGIASAQMSPPPAEYKMPPQPAAAMAAGPPVSVIDPQQAERSRQSMAEALARLNSGKLFGGGPWQG